MTQEPLFSIITVCYNAAGTIMPTLESVDGQSCKDYEHIVVDGASSDGTLDIITGRRTPLRRVISEPDGGIYDAMNKGLGLAAGRYVIFLNAGDRFHSTQTLDIYRQAISDNDSPGIVYGQTDLVDMEGRFLAPRHLTAPQRLTYKDFRHGMLVCHQAMCVLRRIAPLYSLNYLYSADYEWCIRCLQHSRRNIYVDVTVIDYLAEGMTTAHRRRSLFERFRIMSFYYGFFPTLWRHLGFIPRFLAHRRRMNRRSNTSSR